MSIVSNVRIYGFNESVAASKYPMSISPGSCTPELTERAISLAQTPIGHGHDQYLTGIIVQFDLTFSIKAWTEAQRYHFLDFVSSQSTMHRITRMDPKKQCNEHVHIGIIEILNTLIDLYNADPTPERYLNALYNVPTGFRLTARMTTNYRQLKTIYAQRKNHRLPEWREFCKWIETLPNANLITKG